MNQSDQAVAQKPNLSVGIILMLASAVCTSFGQLFWKLSNGQINWFLLLGFVLYGLGALTMIIAFRFGKMSVLHPILSSSYVIAVILSMTVLNESINTVKIIAICFVIVGVIFIGGGKDD